MTPGEPFIAEEYKAAFGLCFRIAVTTNPMMGMLDGSGRKANFASALAEFVSVRAGEAQSSRSYP